jgi:hypothetical protein
LCFSAAVLFTETTQDVNLFLPLFITTIFSKSVGDWIIPALYIKSLQLKDVPLIPESISRKSKSFQAIEVMQFPIVSIR